MCKNFLDEKDSCLKTKCVIQTLPQEIHTVTLIHMLFYQPMRCSSKHWHLRCLRKMVQLHSQHFRSRNTWAFLFFSFCFRRNCMCLKFSTSEIASPRKSLKLSSLSIFNKVNKIEWLAVLKITKTRAEQSLNAHFIWEKPTLSGINPLYLRKTHFI